ncbi:MAG TPA: class I SAM-dependent methyltransferase [Elusimicrobiota bacterium]|jgi:SAM-dependent methyltransferase|nr:class I SAM-dependent methyltransferase [Elusimicrobiota bacterium]
MGAGGLFDDPASYDEMLKRGISLSGEEKDFFIAGRLAALLEALPPGFAPRRILDFGCGTGQTSAALAPLFDGAEVAGTDASAPALAAAAAIEEALDGVSFFADAELAGQAPFDLAYTNGVFHHVEPARRPETLARLRDALKPGGYLAFFENNPWNPGTRWVMSRIPFDRDAQMLSMPEARRLLEEAGFAVVSSRSLFYFPRALAALRVLEPAMAALPLGAQYLVLAKRSPRP